MVAKGRDASDLFPAVVKNVVSKNIEVKKLVYVYFSTPPARMEELLRFSCELVFQWGVVPGEASRDLIEKSATLSFGTYRLILNIVIILKTIKIIST